jgi:hypothetical protein
VGEIAAPKSFNPKPTIDALKPQMLTCFNEARAQKPSIHGKLHLRVTVNEGGNAMAVDADPGEPAYDPGLLACVGTAVRAAHFPKPGGTATVVVPLVFHR